MKTIKTYILLAVSTVSFLVGVPVGAATFKNPVDKKGQDPWVIQRCGKYHYCWSVGAIKISRAIRLQDIASEPATTIWTPPDGQPYSQNVWAPELHFLQGKWYVYFAADDGDNANHRMYVLESSTDDPFGSYTLRGKIFDSTDKWAIDGTVLDFGGQLYFIWSGWQGDVNIQQNLYIAPMSNPWTISGNRTLISQPVYAWEKVGGPPYINEGPQILVRNGRVFVIYSASGSWTDDYCLGRLELVGTNALDASSWTKNDSPVFSKTSQVFGPGHASFVKSTDYTEDWIVYHAAKYSGAGWNRNVRIQSFNWNPDGTPDFGTPVTAGVHLTEPAGSLFGVTYEAEDAVINNAQILSSSKASGEAKVGHIDYSNSFVEFTVNITNAGSYRLHVRYGAGDGAASHTLSVNGMNTQTVVYSQVEWDDWHFQTNNLVSMQAGTNLIRFTKEDGFAELDFIGINPGPEGDIDADGLPDPWERRYFCHLYNPCGIPDTDCDGDGQTTLQECVADTDPTNHCSFLGLTSIQFSYDNPVIYWQGGISATQYLERCVSLTSGVSWSVLFTNIPPTSTTTNWIDSSPDQPAAFYRIRVMR